jgi:hypothetical protein
MQMCRAKTGGKFVNDKKIEVRKVIMSVQYSLATPIGFGFAISQS